MREKIEEMQYSIMALSFGISVVRLVAVLGLAALAVVYIEEHGLKHLVETIWLGPGM